VGTFAAALELKIHPGFTVLYTYSLSFFSDKAVQVE
jgi:hypothetical protein